MCADPTAATVAVAAETPALQSQARALAARLHLDCVPADDPAHEFHLQLVALDRPPGFRLQLQARGADAPGPIYAEFAEGALGHRRRFGGGRGQPLARAAGLKKGANPRVLDVTGGLGRDGFVLACLGCPVTLVERSPVVAALLANALERARHHEELKPVIERVSVIEADALQTLESLCARLHPEVIYMDPMYPHRTKSALVKKEMRIFRRLVGDDPDAAALLASARRCVAGRVVVKRPRGAPPLGNGKPAFDISSKNTRFDVYVGVSD